MENKSLLEIVEKYGNINVLFFDSEKINKLQKIGKLDPIQRILYKALLTLDYFSKEENLLPKIMPDFNNSNSVLQESIWAIETAFLACFNVIYPDELAFGQFYYVDSNFDVWTALEIVCN
jgi:hypothetical protein